MQKEKKSIIIFFLIFLLALVIVEAQPVANGGGGGGGSSCNLQDPTVSISPSSQTVYRGETATYTVTVTNNDDVCAHTFSLSVSCPVGVSCNLDRSSLTVSAGGSGSVTLSASTTNVGSFSLTVSADDGVDGLSGSGSATLVVDCDPALKPACSDVCDVGGSELRVNGRAVCTDDGWVCDYDVRYCTSGSLCDTVSCGGVTYQCRSLGWFLPCDDQDGWYDTGNTECRAPTGSCVGTLYKEQEYRDYYCSATTGDCSYVVNDTRWVDTGQSCTLPAGTVCQRLVQPCPDGGRYWCSVINGNDNILVYIPAEAPRVWRCDASANCVLSEDYCADQYNVVEDCDDRDGTYNVPGGTQVRDYYCVEDCTRYNCAACEYTVLDGTETDCADGVDNDGDGLADCADSDCAGKLGPNGVTCCQSNADCAALDCGTYVATCRFDNICGCKTSCSDTRYDCAEGACCTAEITGGEGTCESEGFQLSYSGNAYLCDAPYGFVLVGEENVNANDTGFSDIIGLLRILFWPFTLVS